MCPQPDAALYVPLLGAHLLENYLADPPLAEEGRAMNPRAAAVVGVEPDTRSGKFYTPKTNPVLGEIRSGIVQLKRDLLELN